MIFIFHPKFESPVQTVKNTPHLQDYLELFTMIATGVKLI